MQSAKEICSDPKGFDRAGWHKQMNADVVSFFQKNLSAGVKASGK
jgi:predicted dienelactone hydrolase